MKTIFILAILLFSEIIFAQEAKNFSVWGNLGGGLSFGKYSDGTGGFSVNYGVSGNMIFIWFL